MSGDRAAGALLEVLGLLESLGVRHHLGGSYASSVHGVPRQTQDADVVADLGVSDVAPFVAALAGSFYLDDERIRLAVAKRSSFNLIHLDTGFKVDVFVQGAGPFDRLELARSQPSRLAELGDAAVPIKSAEDTVLRKLQWFAEGGRVSERQWRDVLGVLKAQAGRLDRDYLDHWADRLGVRGLLDEAIAEVGD